MARHPLAEVFGFPISNFSAEANRHRAKRLCPYNNKVPNCTKDKAKDPLGVCSVYDNSSIAITCPIRFRQDWLIADDAASFFFPPNVAWTSLTEVRLSDKSGRSAGNIDIVLVAYDDHGRVLDFGALEVQQYISQEIFVMHSSITWAIRKVATIWFGRGHITLAPIIYRPRGSV
jgi:hypothetical protein